MQHGERFNTVTHTLGLLLAMAGAVAIMVKILPQGDDWKVWSIAVFALSMICLYAASSLYHAATGPAKEIWAKVDHCAIYLLIAGTYTPFALVTLKGAWGWSLFGAVWALAALGIAKELLLGRDRVPSVPIYLLMGWIGVLAAWPLIHGLPTVALLWILAGGLLYTAGVPFYAKSEAWRHAHGVWHLFVLAGTGSHFFVVFRYVA
jgi:hemolysin III